MTHKIPIDRRRFMIATAGAAAMGLGHGMRSSAGSLINAAQAAPMLLQKVPGTPTAPAFSLPDLDGATRTLDEFSGRVVIANFWATWCPPCRAEIPSMQRAWDKLDGNGAVMLAFHVGGDADRIWAFLAEFNVTFPVLIDASGKVAAAWKTIGLPTTYVVDGKGRKALRAIGERAWDDAAIIEQIMTVKG